MSPEMSRENGRILVVEDEAVIALDVRQRLEGLGYEVCGVVDSGPDALAVATETQPDLILMDIVLHGRVDGIDVAAELLDRLETAVIFLTAHTEPETLERAKRVGPLGFVTKPFAERDLDIAIQMALWRQRREAVARRQSRRLTALGRSFEGKVVDDFNHLVSVLTPPLQEVLSGVQSVLSDAESAPGARDEADGSDAQRRWGLSRREWEVVQGLMSHRRVSEVARVLGISVHTARNHLKSISRKLHVHSQSEMIRVLLSNHGDRGIGSD